MTIHRDRYLSGAAFFVGAIHRKGGKRVSVFDRALRWRRIAQAMRQRGLEPAVIAYRLRRPAPLVERVTTFGYRFAPR